MMHYTTVTITEFRDGFWYASAYHPNERNSPIGNAKSFFRPLAGAKARADLRRRGG